MAFEKFQPNHPTKRGAPSVPFIRFSKRPTMNLSTAARAMLDNPERVSFLVDPDNPKIFAVVADPDGHRVNPQSGLVSAAGITNHLGNPAGRFMVRQDGDMIVCDLTEVVA